MHAGEKVGEPFVQPVGIYGREGDSRLIRDSSGLGSFVEESLPDLSGGGIGRITKQLSGAVVSLLDGRRPKNLEGITREGFRGEGPTHTLKGKIDSKNSFSASLRLQIEKQQVPLTIISISRTSDRRNRRTGGKKRIIFRRTGNSHINPRFKQ